MAKLYYITTTRCPEPKPRKLKNGDTVYDIVFRIVYQNGEVHQKRLSGFSSKALAKQAHTEFITTYCELLPRNLEPRKKGVMFEEAFALYFQYIQTYQKESSCYSRKKVFEKHILPIFTGVQINSLTKEDLYKWQDNMFIKINPATNLPYSKSNILKIRGYFSAFLSWVEDRYDIPNLLLRVKIPPTILRQSTSKKGIEFWEDIEFYKFIDSVDDILYNTLFSFLYFTGCRKGEAIAASEIDYNGKTLHINKTYTNKTLDGSKYIFCDYECDYNAKMKN